MDIKSLAKRLFATMGYELHRGGASLPTWVPPGHFYSPIVDVEELRRDAGRVFNRDIDIPDLDLNERGQLSLLAEFAKLYQAIPFTKFQSTPNLYYYENAYYSYGDAIILFCILNHFRPGRLVEFGSGFSSCAALDTNRLLGNQIKCTFIDPHPERLRSLLAGYDSGAVEIIQSRAQDINPADFSDLERNDIVFIDSTHVCKAGSDVNFHLFELLPRLAPGVLIHFHDVFYPFEYPEAWFFEENRSWNENYLLRAFLTANEDYEIVFFNDFMGRKHSGAVADAMPLFGENPGGALWIRKLARTLF